MDERQRLLCESITNALLEAEVLQKVEKMRFFVNFLKNAVITYNKSPFNSQFSKAIDTLNRAVSEALSSSNKEAKPSTAPGIVSAFTPDRATLSIVERMKKSEE
mgnify:FL=1